MAYIPKQWKDLPDETTPIQASDLNHIEQGINDLNTSVSNLNTSIGDLNTLDTTDKSSIVGAINEVYQNNVYSSDEKIIGKWIDGKPIYRKVVEFGSFPNNTSKNVATGIENISRIIQLEYSWYDSTDKNYMSGIRVDSTAAMCKVMFNFPNKSLYVEGFGTNWSTRTSQGIAIIYYTKTTD